MTEILLAASDEMAEAAAGYDERVSGLGERFLGEAEAAFVRIVEKPLLGSPWNQRRLPDGVPARHNATNDHALRGTI